MTASKGYLIGATIGVLLGGYLTWDLGPLLFVGAGAAGALGGWLGSKWRRR